MDVAMDLEWQGNTGDACPQGRCLGQASGRRAGPAQSVDRLALDRIVLDLIAQTAGIDHVIAAIEATDGIIRGRRTAPEASTAIEAIRTTLGDLQRVSALVATAIDEQLALARAMSAVLPADSASMDASDATVRWMAATAGPADVASPAA